eukprot:jgi/Psemu1/215631/e_gw1.752.7.1
MIDNAAVSRLLSPRSERGRRNTNGISCASSANRRRDPTRACLLCLLVLVAAGVVSLASGFSASSHSILLPPRGIVGRSSSISSSSSSNKGRGRGTIDILGNKYRNRIRIRNSYHQRSIVASTSTSTSTSTEEPIPPTRTTATATANATPVVPHLSKNQEALGKRTFPRTWVPLASVHELDPDRPTPLVFLEQRYIAYHDPNAKSSDGWIVMDDACPHRLAPLSEGRVARVEVEDESADDTETSNSTTTKTKTKTTLMCSYHGWEFDGSQNGACTSIPQATPEIESRARASPLSRATTYSVRVHKNVVWAWLWPEDVLGYMVDGTGTDTGTDTANMITPEGLTAGMASGGDFPSTYTRDLPYGWDSLIENLIDPAHIPFAHHGLQGKREDALPIDMTVPEAIPGPGWPGFLFEFRDRTMGKHRISTGEFRGPYSVVYEGKYYATQEEADAISGKLLAAKRQKIKHYLAAEEAKGTAETKDPLGPFYLGIICIPTKPGWSRAIIFSRGNAKPDTESKSKSTSETAKETKKKKTPLIGKIFSALPTWVVHVLSNRFLDSDLAFLHYQEQERLRYRYVGNGGNEGNNAPSSSSSSSSLLERQSLGYFLPAPSDRCVTAIHEWIAKHTDYKGGDGIRSTHTYTLPPPISSRTELFDRYLQHTSHCKHCQEGLNWLTKTVRKACYWTFAGSVLVGHFCPREGRRLLQLLTKVAALAALAVLGIVAKIEPAFRVGEFKHYQND